MADHLFMYPNVTSVPQRGIEVTDRLQPQKKDGIKSEFDHVLGDALDHIKQPLKFSAHASQRLQERKIQLDTDTMSKVNDAIDKAEAKGIEDTLVLTSDAALIVNVKNRTVITAMDKGSLNGNVFSNIDGAVIV